MHKKTLNAGGFGRTYLLTPEPEIVSAPTAFLLGTLGLSLAGWRLCRREGPKALRLRPRAY